MMNSALIISLLFLAGFVAQWIAWRSKLPAILFLLFTGVMLGPVLGFVNPDELMGDLLFPFVSLAVAIILFEGALTLKFDEVRTLGSVVQRLVTVGALLCWVVTSIATHYLFSLNWGISILFGAITVVTGPTVIVPMLRTVRPTTNIARILRWEGIVIDPIGALLAVVVFEFLTSLQSGHALSHSLGAFFWVLLVGFSLGALGGYLMGLMLKRRWVPGYLMNMASLAHVFLAFTVANSLAHEAGLLAVTVMGMWLANTRGIHIEEILNFKENLSLVLISGLFIILAARISPADIASLGWNAFALLLVLQLVVRPLSMLISTYGSELSWRERSLLAWIAPRGIVAAAVSALFAIRLQDAGFEGAELLVPLTFTVIIGTVLIQSVTARPLAKFLKVAHSSPRGFLIIGANTVAVTIAKALKEAGSEVIVCDSNWSAVRNARMAGLNSFYGNPVSEYADQKLDLVGIGKMLALTPFRELNTIASLRYRSEFGIDNIFTVPTDLDVTTSDKHRIAAGHQGNILFNRFLTFGQLRDLIDRGAEIKRTKLSAEFNYPQFIEHNRDKAIPLFAISPKGRVETFIEGGKMRPEAGWSIISLSYEDVYDDPINDH